MPCGPRLANANSHLLPMRMASHCARYLGWAVESSSSKEATMKRQSFVKGFPIVDGHKNRARALAEPFINKYAQAGRDYPNMQYPSRRENYAAWIGARYAVQFGHSAYFGQSQLDGDARGYMTLRTRKIHGNGTWFPTLDCPWPRISQPPSHSLRHGSSANHFGILRASPYQQ